MRWVALIILPALFSVSMYAQRPLGGAGGGGGGGSSSGANVTVCAATGGSANAQACPGSPVPTTLTNLTGTFIPNFANTTTATLNIAGLGAKIIDLNGVPTSSSVLLVAGQPYQFYYDGSLIQASGGASSGAGPTVCNGSASATAATCVGSPVPTTYTNLSGYFIAGATSTGAPLTLNISGLGAKNVFLNGSATSATNFVTSGQAYPYYYDGTQIQLIQPPTFASSVSSPAFLGTGTGPYINLPTNTSHSYSSGDINNNGGVLQFNNGTQTLNLNTPAQFCGTVAACGHTIQNAPQIVYGSVALATGAPSTATVTGISPAFTSSTSFNCTIAAQSSATGALLSVANVSGSSFTITGPAAVTTVINYICVGI